MFQFFYSTKIKKTPLVDTSMSLGGYVSVNGFINSKINSFFPPSINFDKSQCRLLIIKNLYNEDKQVSLHLTTESENVKYMIGLVLPAMDDCNVSFFETIEDYSDPIYCNFSDTEDPIDFTIQSGGLVGVWIKKVKKEHSDGGENDKDDICGASKLQNVKSSIIEEFNISLTLQ